MGERRTVTVIVPRKDIDEWMEYQKKGTAAQEIDSLSVLQTLINEPSGPDSDDKIMARLMFELEFFGYDYRHIGTESVVDSLTLLINDSLEGIDARIIHLAKLDLIGFASPPVITRIGPADERHYLLVIEGDPL